MAVAALLVTAFPVAWCGRSLPVTVFLVTALPCTALVGAALVGAALVGAALVGAALVATRGFGGAAERALPGALPPTRAAATDGVATAPPSNSPPMTVAAIARRI
jgi:hypothetical protein